MLAPVLAYRSATSAGRGGHRQTERRQLRCFRCRHPGQNDRDQLVGRGRKDGWVAITLPARTPSIPEKSSGIDGRKGSGSGVRGRPEYNQKVTLGTQNTTKKSLWEGQIQPKSHYGEIEKCQKRRKIGGKIAPLQYTTYHWVWPGRLTPPGPTLTAILSLSKKLLQEPVGTSNPRGYPSN